MTWDEALKRCDMLINGFSVNNATYEAFKDNEKGYPTFNMVKEFAETCKEAVRKQTPMQKHHTRIDHINDDVRVSICPDCLGLIYTHKNEYPKFCTQCGQKID